MEKSNSLEQVILLGLITLVGAGSSLFLALAALLITVACFALVSVFSSLFSKISLGIRSLIAVSLAFSLAWYLALMAPLILPLPENISGTYMILVLAGLNPIVYLSLGDREFRGREVAKLIIFSFLLMAIAACREYLGNGTLFGYLVPPYWVSTMVLFREPAGGFFILGGLVLLERLGVFSRSSREAISRGGEA